LEVSKMGLLLVKAVIDRPDVVAPGVVAHDPSESVASE